MPSLHRRMTMLMFPALCATTPAAWAHAIVTVSDPRVDARVAGPSLPIALHFNSRIDHGLSRLSLVTPDGKTETLALDPETSPDLLTAKATGLTPGAYRLHWQVLSVDGHITRGDIPFTVGR